MKFRPCIDIHNGAVKQIIGKSLSDENSSANENFVSQKDAAYYARLYEKDRLTGGHMILLNKVGTKEYEKDAALAAAALKAYPGGLQIGGGITAENASRFLSMGASHVIVTSYIFQDGRLLTDRLTALCEAVGKKHLVLDLSCRKKDGCYYVVTDRWQKFTDIIMSHETLRFFSCFCDEFLIHAVDVEGCQSGIEADLIPVLAQCPIPVTYAGGIASEDDISRLNALGGGRIDFTVGSALDLFGGNIAYKTLVQNYH